jgi:Tfp pilus assembly protein PilX
MTEPEKSQPVDPLLNVTFPLERVRGYVQKNKEVFMALRRQGMTKKQIAEKTGVPEGSLGTFLGKWADEVRYRNEKASAELERKARAFDASQAAVQEDGEDDEDKEDEEGAPSREGATRKNQNAATAAIIDKELRKGLKHAARTVINAAKGGKIDAQSLGAAKLLLKKYGLLQEEYEAKESQYAKMSSEELCDRNLMAIVVLLRSRGQFKRAEIIERALKDVKEAQEVQPEAAA